MNRAPDNSDGTGRTDAPNGAETDQLLLPGWSSLVILLIIFGVLSTITILAIVREGDVHVTPDVGGTQAHSPNDFPEVDFDEPLLPAVLEADGDDQPGGYNVPPPPFSNTSSPAPAPGRAIATTSTRASFAVSAIAKAGSSTARPTSAATPNTR